MGGTKRIIVLFAFVVAVVAALLITSAVVKSKNAGAADPNKLTLASFKGKPAPDFSLDTIDGKKLSLADLRGKAVVVNFWATWCPPCKVETPWLVDLQQKYGPEGLQIVGIAMDDASNEEIAKFAKDLGMNYPVLLGKEDVAQKYGGVEFLPVTFYVDRNGNVFDRHNGIVSRPDMEETVKHLLATQAGS